MNGYQKLKSIITDERWSNFLDPFLLSNDMKAIYDTIVAEATAGTVIYPRFDNLFKAFNVCDYNNLKVIIVGQDPYPDGAATG